MNSIIKKIIQIIYSYYKLFIAILFLAIFTLLIMLWYNCNYQIAWLSKITGLGRTSLLNINRETDRGVLFGDTIFAWHLYIGNHRSDVLINAIPSDEADYNFTVMTLREMMPYANDIPNNGVVYKKQIGRAKIYFIFGDIEGSLYILDMRL